MLERYFPSSKSQPLGGPGGGYSDIFFYIRRLEPSFGVQILEFQYFLWVCGKMNIWDMKILWLFLGGITKLDWF